MVKEWVKKHKKSVWIIVFLILFILLIMFGTQIYLWVNFHLGNDLIVNLKANPENLNLQHGETQKVSFQSTIISNPFCKAECTAHFRDISNDQIVDTAQFILSTGSGFTKEYLIEPEAKGSGQKLYTFTIECHGRSNFLCHTSEEKVTRNILLTVNYDYSLYEKELQADFISKINSSLAEYSRLKAEKRILDSRLDELTPLIETLSLIVQLKNINSEFLDIDKQLNSLSSVWHLQDYHLIASSINDLKSKVEKVNGQVRLAGDSIESLILRYNDMTNQMDLARSKIIRLQDSFIVEPNWEIIINQTSIYFNKASSLIRLNNELDQKEAISQEFIHNFTLTYSYLWQNMKISVLQREIELDLVKDQLCQISGTCINHSNIPERANQSIFLLNETCKEQKNLILLLKKVNVSLNERYSNLSYPNSSEFWYNLTLILNNIQQNLISSYRTQIPDNSNNSAVLNSILSTLIHHSSSPVPTYSEYDLAPALMELLAKRNFYNCEAINLGYPYLSPVLIVNFTDFEPQVRELDFSLSLPPPQCCAFKQCHACCNDSSCREDPQFYPIIFLHGHAFNKDVSTEYSLDAFNQIQDKLEEEDYINAGSVSLYTKTGLPGGLWGRIQSPLTIKASYYYDAVLKADNYVLVQTKSENIDTYAVRLKEILDTITYRTGRPKVIIVAHSMGGLVARRYLQIFGTEKVDKLIMIGTPNQGVTGEVANLCPVVGEDLECRDLTEGSVLLDKLNLEPLPKIPIYNFVGTGCDMGNVPGDGIVLEKSAWLEGAQNFLIRGSCSGLNNLHTGMLDIVKYPELYKQLIIWLKN